MTHLKPIVLSLLLAITFGLVACHDDALSPQSVVEADASQHPFTELDQWIQDSITHPYGIAVEYRWNKHVAPTASYVFPPQSDNVKAVLQTLKALWLDLYTDAQTGGAKFLEGKRPLKLYLFGGDNLDTNGVPLLSHRTASNVEMYLFNVNDFQARDTASVYRLMRSVHHQFAKRLGEIFPYDRDKFQSIAPQWYTHGSTADLRIQLTLIKHPVDFYKPSAYARYHGMYTYHSILSPEEEFAEIISTHLMHTPRELNTIAKAVRTPLINDPDPEQAAADKAYAEARYAEFVAKRDFVETYFQKTVGIPLPLLQTLSLKKQRQWYAR